MKHKPRGLATTVLALALSSTIYALSLLATSLPQSLLIPPIMAGIAVFAVMGRSGEARLGRVFTVGFISGLIGALAVPFYLGTLGFHIRLSGEFLTTPVAVALLSYHGLATGLVAYVISSFNQVRSPTPLGPGEEE